MNVIETEDLDTLRNVVPKVIIIGDLNSRHKAWDCHINNHNGLTLYKYSLINCCSIMYPDEPTHYPANGTTPITIDLAVNKNVSNVIGPEVLSELVSDHKPIQFKIGNYYKHSLSVKECYAYTKADWVKYKQKLDQTIHLNNQILTIDDIEQETEKIPSNIPTSLEETISKDKKRRTPTRDSHLSHQGTQPHQKTLAKDWGTIL